MVETSGDWEADVAKAIERYLKPDWTFLDIGANVGYFSLLAAARGNDVIAIEADAEACEILKRNAERNKVASLIDVHSLAVSDSDGIAYLSDYSVGNPGGQYLADTGREVATKRLINVLGDRRPEFIKIDIEGMEYAVLNDAPEVLEGAQVVVFETAVHASRYGVTPDAVVNLLRRAGFTVTYTNGQEIDAHWLAAIDSTPDAYINLLARREVKVATRATVLLCAWRNMVIETAESLLALRDAGWGYSIVRGDALIIRSRSRAVSNWYRFCPDEDVFLMIDDDVVFDIEHAERVVELAREKRTIAVGAYVVKDGGHLACRRLPGQDIVFGPKSEPVEIKYPATGFMAVHRDVIEAMVQAIEPDGEPLFPLTGVDPGAMYPFFDTFTVKNEDGSYEYLSEDYAFGEQARRLGFKVWLDPSVILFHMGTFPYNVHDMKNTRRVEDDLS